MVFHVSGDGKLRDCQAKNPEDCPYYRFKDRKTFNDWKGRNPDKYEQLKENPRTKFNDVKIDDEGLVVVPELKSSNNGKRVFFKVPDYYWESHDHDDGMAYPFDNAYPIPLTTDELSSDGAAILSNISNEALLMRKQEESAGISKDDVENRSRDMPNKESNGDLSQSADNENNSANDVYKVPEQTSSVIDAYMSSNESFNADSIVSDERFRMGNDANITFRNFRRSIFGFSENGVNVMNMKIEDDASKHYVVDTIKRIRKNMPMDSRIIVIVKPADRKYGKPVQSSSTILNDDESRNAITYLNKFAADAGIGIDYYVTSLDNGVQITIPPIPGREEEQESAMQFIHKMYPINTDISEVSIWNDSGSI